MNKFPKEFLWGTATAGHQIEGNNINSDWWAWENRERKNSEGKNKWPLESSNDACDSYNRYEEDFDLCAKLNNTAIRIGIEWSRIEPEEGKIDYKEIEHYKNVLLSAKKRDLKTFVTLFHFVLPNWVAKKGGWTNHTAPWNFAKFAKLCANEFGPLIDVYLTINEPQVYALESYTIGIWPPQKNNLFLSLICQLNLAKGHNLAFNAIKSVGNFKVGIVKNIVWYKTHKDSKIKFIDQLLSKFVFWLNSDFFLGLLKKHFDVLGLNYYFTNEFKNLKIDNTNDRVSDLGWWLYTPGIKNVLLHLNKYKVPIYITENGLADAKDEQRTKYLLSILKECHMAIEKGVNLKGYFHWSLLDNYEWAQGFWPRFGLVEIDRNAGLKRVPRNSFYAYAKICENGTID